MASIKFEGIDELERALINKGKLDIVKQIIRKHGAELNQGVVRNAVFTRGYSTGQTRRSIHLTFHNNGLEARVKPSTEYSPYLEHGTRFMSAQPFVGPAFNSQKEKFKNDIERLV